MKYILEIKSQKSRGSSGGRFGGPDKYVAVQVVPDGVEPLKALIESAAKKRGIEIKYFGEGYWQNTGPQSMLGRAIAAAKDFIKQQEAKCSSTPTTNKS